MTVKKKRISPILFFQQVRQEIGRVTWPTRHEVLITSVLVFVMVFTFAVFFLGVDAIISSIIQWVLGWKTL